ncbi:uncharacterized protein [Penaeus vannamei]|uniref:Uncharacterized protein n=1 Tax=Penaeus vannamei TaxID=6689 RepID=A0A3R7MCQ0_PENVA|nr:uncharacterized protein LOC113803207 [Penaeus vannamei]ROT78364.1 hypothetical protein C7M84_002922 [Penaeus vannamei]
MRRHQALLLVVLFAFLLPALRAHKVEHDKFIKKHEDEAEARELESLESNEEDDDDDEEFDLEEEMFGNHDRRNEGINLLDESMDVVLSEPSDRVLRALAAPEGHPKKLSFEKVKEVHRERMARLAEENVDRSPLHQDFQEMLEREHEAVEDDDNEGFLNKVLRVIW